MNPVYIKKNNSQFQILLALKTNRSKRNELNEIFIEGVSPIKAALLTGKMIKRIIYNDYENLSNWSKRLIDDNKTSELISVEKQLYKELSDRTDPSEIIITVSKENPTLDQFKLKNNPFIVIFDRPSNHGNLGSIIRSANAFGADLIITTGHSIDIFDPAVIRASLGGIFFTEVHHEESMTELQNWIEKIKSRYKDLSLIGTDSGAKVSLHEYKIKRPVILLLGNEGRGLSSKLKDMVDTMIKIPMTGRVDSLNVACAAGIIMHDIYKNSIENGYNCRIDISGGG